MSDTRIGKNYRVFIAPELFYGIKPTTGTYIEIPDVCDMNKVITSIDVTNKTGTLKKQEFETQRGTETATVSINGNFSSNHEIMLSAAMFDNSSPRTLQEHQPALYSYTIAKVYTDDEKVDYITGCTAEGLTINGESGAIVQYNITFRGKTLLREQPSGSLGGLTLSSCPVNNDPFLFSNVTADVVAGAISKINDFELTITNTFQGDKEIYQNSNSKELEILTGVAAELKYSWNYNKNDDADVFNNLVNSYTDNVITLEDTSNNGFEIQTSGKNKEYNAPDPGDGLFVSSVTVELLSNCGSSREALKITNL